jgi:hypothetical protein
MRNGLSFLGALAMTLTTALASPAAAQPNDKPPGSVIIEYCKPSFDETQSVGECMGYARADEEATATQFCLYLQDTGFFIEPDITLGDCVTILRSQL